MGKHFMWKSHRFLAIILSSGIRGLWYLEAQKLKTCQEDVIRGIRSFKAEMLSARRDSWYLEALKLKSLWADVIRGI